MSRPTSQFQNWVFTAYGVADGDLVTDLLADADVSDLSFDEMIPKAQWSLELCPKTQRVHIQGMCRFKKRVVFSTAKAHLLKTVGKIHLEEMKGTWEDSLLYTSKAASHIAGPFRVGIRDPSAPFTRIVEYWHGPPHSYKSTTARKYLSDKGYDVYEMAKSTASKGTWIAGYSDEEACIMDEVDYNWFDESGWKKVLDRMPQKMPAGAGGKNIEWNPVHIILISNYPPTKFADNPAIWSRISEVVKFDAQVASIPQPKILNAASKFSFIQSAPSKPLRKDDVPHSSALRQLVPAAAPLSSSSSSVDYDLTEAEKALMDGMRD